MDDPALSKYVPLKARLHLHMASNQKTTFPVDSAPSEDGEGLLDDTNSEMTLSCPTRTGLECRKSR